MHHLSQGVGLSSAPSSSSSTETLSKPTQQHTPTKKTSSGSLLQAWRKTYHAVGFSKAYNFVLFFIFAGAMLGFALARMEYLSVGGRYREGSSPGEWYWYQRGRYRVGITLHLGAIIPAGFLMVWQFVPWIRHHALIFHQVNGWAVSCLVIVGNVGALMICRRAFGGEPATQVIIGLLAILTTIGLSMAIYNIKRLQIDQHRAWMLRTMFWLGTIITTRIIMIISGIIITEIGSYYVVATCGEVKFVDGDHLSKVFNPQCWAPGANADLSVPVHANFNGTATQVGASLKLGFSTGLWLAFFLHFVGVEIYLKLTPREAERLRQVSYERQKAAGFAHPGSAGLTVDRWGDAEPWVPARDLEAKAAEESRE